MFTCRTFQSAEKTFFRTLNRVAEPAIRRGIGSPWLVPVGAVVLETIGRKSGRTYRIPVLASELRGVLVVSTVRGRSQWIKNLAAEPQINVWLRGQLRPCTAYVVGDGELQTTGVPSPSSTVSTVLGLLRRASSVGSTSFVVLVLAQAGDETAVDSVAGKAVPMAAEVPG